MWKINLPQWLHLPQRGGQEFWQAVACGPKNTVSPKLMVSLYMWMRGLCLTPALAWQLGEAGTKGVAHSYVAQMTQACMGICVSRAHMDKGKPIRYGRMPGSQADVEFSPFQSCLEMSGAVGL